MLTPGARLGPYEVIGPIGAGGMGEVYRGRDTRLRRDVAIKVLTPAVSADPTRRKRFEVEARAIAALSHPHICPIYDVGAEGELQYLVLELVQGETLAARLKRGPMPLAEVLTRAVEMADAMATAHRAASSIAI
jgi:serine/threonine protein kinase